ncbi:MAG: 50S ribosomal protein L1 [Phycisphaerae bacterium]|nr:50S ribosomal protein L1 [Phycisphaerae bacterium]NIP53710.1 50S ribosomal protein L1 [Phycisphaerae bacterium]NIS52632.1 50S ribosomal protein L1 [Phycisphaerae bacterium]NIU10111.1 50S ribosomal protein L1 [Phycisphaerae bacterium]NIV02705.1 50S ribosomal protein L1 [Phycisphaerae bacterium]
MGFRSKRYKQESEQVTKEPVSLSDAVEKVKLFKSVKFDQSIECVMHLGIDPKQADQMVRGSISLPHGIGKQKKVIAFCEDADIEAAKNAGAIEAGCDDLIKKVSDGWLDFDVAIASPKVMGKVGKLGRILGPQGKMPSPKNGTVTGDVTTAVAEFAAGKVEFRNDAGGNVHTVVGKQSFESEKLIGNIEAFVSHIKKIKPAAAKGTYIKKVTISATMSPSVTVSI